MISASASRCSTVWVRRQGGFGQANWHLQEAIDEADDRVAEVIENGAAPFWEIVREAVEARVES